MQRNAGIIAGAGAAALLVVIASQTGVLSAWGKLPEASSAPPAVSGPETVAEAPAPAPAPEIAQPIGTASDPAVPGQLQTAVPEAAPDLAANAEIARLTALIEERERAYAEAAEALASRDGELARLKALMTERDAELARLRAEIETLRTEAAIDAQLAELKPAPETPSLSAAPDAPTTFRISVAGDGDAEDLPGAPAPEPGLAAGRLTAVHFDPSSARLSPGGLAHAAAAAVTLSDMRIGRIKVVGYTDRVGRPASNQSLATARAHAVADFLIRAGLPADMIEIEGMGESSAPIPTDDGVAEPLNRCAEIIAIPL